MESENEGLFITPFILLFIRIIVVLRETWFIRWHVFSLSEIQLPSLDSCRHIRRQHFSPQQVSLNRLQFLVYSLFILLSGDSSTLPSRRLSTQYTFPPHNILHDFGIACALQQRLFMTLRCGSAVTRRGPSPSFTKRTFRVFFISSVRLFCSMYR